MTRRLVVDEAVAEESDAQIRFYAQRAGQTVAFRFVGEIEAIYGGLVDERLVGVNHPRVRFRVAIKRVFLERYPFAVVFYVENDTVYVVALEALRKRPGYWRSRLRSR